MQISIVGLPKSGKTTIFNAVTRGNAQVATYGTVGAKPNIGVVKVPDARLDTLTEMFKPERKVPAEVSYVDVPATPEGFGESQGISGEYLSHLQRADVLLIVVRAFEDPSVPHVNDTIDPVRDAGNMVYELAFADLQILEKRLIRVKEGFKGAKAAERELLTKEQTLLTRLKETLEADIPVRDQKLTSDEARSLEGFKLLTAKPLIIAVNIGENQLADIEAITGKISERFSGPQIRSTALCGSLEMELAQMSPADEAEFRASLGLRDSGLDRMIRLSFDVTNLISFFTVQNDECRSWTVTRGTPVQRAAGKIHSDLERGFIRAEVISYKDMIECGTLVEAKKRGILHQEGKTYIVQDGDIINVLFNV